MDQVPDGVAHTFQLNEQWNFFKRLRLVRIRSQLPEITQVGVEGRAEQYPVHSRLTLEEHFERASAPKAQQALVYGSALRWTEMLPLVVVKPGEQFSDMAEFVSLSALLSSVAVVKRGMTKDGAKSLSSHSQLEHGWAEGVVVQLLQPQVGVE